MRGAIRSLERTVGSRWPLFVRITLLRPHLRVSCQPLEHLLRHCARPPFAMERLSVRRGADGRGPPTDWAELVQGHFRPGNLSGVARLFSPTSTYTASVGFLCHGADRSQQERFQGRSAPTRKIRP
jgi:hypothetical protein